MRKRFRLEDNHPHMRKFDEACRLLDSLGVTLCAPSGVLAVTIEGVTYDVNGIEGQDAYLLEFPPAFEVKLTFLKEEE